MVLEERRRSAGGTIISQIMGDCSPRFASQIVRAGASVEPTTFNESFAFLQSVVLIRQTGTAYSTRGFG